MSGAGLSSTERDRLSTYAQRLLEVALHEAADAALNQSCARSYGWRTGFEFLVWNLLNSTPFAADTRVMRAAIGRGLDEIRQLSADAGGWMTWEPTLGKLVFVALPDWLTLYDSYSSPR